MMDWILLIIIGVVGGLSTLGMINMFWYFHDKENK